MVQVLIANKAMTVNPFKVSQPMGASLALMGIRGAIPLEHGAQGCTAFSKVFFTRHFREPIPLQTTAMDQIVTILGADGNVVEALDTIARTSGPEVVGLISTGLSETQGADIPRTIKEFRRQHPEWDGMAVVPISTPDTLGNLESGFARAVEALITHLVPRGNGAGKRPRQVNVLASSMLTPGDLEALRTWIEAFGLQPVLVPDLADSLDGHLTDQGYSHISQGGVTRSSLASLGEARATLVIGASMSKAADLLQQRTGVPDFRFAGLMGLAACDALTHTLSHLSGREVPPQVERWRAQLLDAMVDGHFLLGSGRAAVAADPDLLCSLVDFLTGVGCRVVTAVASARADSLHGLPLETVIVGDLEDWADQARAGGANLLLANSHGAMGAAELGRPLLRTGFPLYDWVGGYAREWIGYRGSRQTLFDLANMAAGQRTEVAPYVSRFASSLGRPAASAAVAAL